MPRSGVDPLVNDAEMVLYGSVNGQASGVFAMAPSVAVTGGLSPKSAAR